MQKQSNFLTHVAGLRGLAILLVVWFHISQNNAVMPPSVTLPFGYFGVDVFFVIMGYFLIGSFAKGKINALDWRSAVRFTVEKFYRLWPPLAVMLIAGSILCLFFLDCDQLSTMARTAKRALEGTANIYLAKSTAGYFAEGSGMNPFLHTWYLSVTVQFFLISYIGYVLWTLCCTRVSRKLALVLLWGVGLVSFFTSAAPGICLLLNACGCSIESPDISYYSTFPRLWTLLAGGLIPLLPAPGNKRWRECLLGIAGLLLVLIPSIQHDERAAHLTPVVVLGTLLLIRYLPGSPAVKLLDNPLMRGIGAISFSLYLVHMPLLVAYKGATFQAPGWEASLLILGVSFLVAWVFWYGVETRKLKPWVCIVLCVIAWGMSQAIHKTKGLRAYWNAEANAVALPSYNGDLKSCRPDSDIWRAFDKAAIKTNAGWQRFAYNQAALNNSIELMALGNQELSPQFVAIGDSHGQHLMSGLDLHAWESGISGVQLTTIMIPYWNRHVSFPNDPSYFFNREKGEAFLSWLEAHPELKVVIVGHHWARGDRMPTDWNHQAVENKGIESHIPQLREFLQRVKAAGKTVILIEPLPVFQNDNILTYARYLKRTQAANNAPAFVCTETEYLERYEKALGILRTMEAEGLCKLINPSPLFFKNGEARAIENGIILFRDNNHITPAGSAMIGELLMQQVKQQLQGK